MAIKNTNYGGTDWTEEGLKPTDLNDTFDATFKKNYASNSGGSTSTTLTETDLTSITITQNDLSSSSSLHIVAPIKFSKGSANRQNCTFRLYVNGSAVKSIVLTAGIENTNSATNRDAFNTLAYLATGVDTTAGNVIVKVTAQTATSESGQTSRCESLLVTGYNI